MQRGINMRNERGQPVFDRHTEHLRLFYYLYRGIEPRDRHTLNQTADHPNATTKRNIYRFHHAGLLYIDSPFLQGASDHSSSAAWEGLYVSGDGFVETSDCRAALRFGFIVGTEETTSSDGGV